MVAQNGVAAPKALLFIFTAMGASNLAAAYAAYLLFSPLFLLSRCLKLNIVSILHFQGVVSHVLWTDSDMRRLEST